MSRAKVDGDGACITYCSCRDCFEYVYTDGARCISCADAGCDGKHECLSPFAYGAHEEDESDEEDSDAATG